jgi:hypothetical protein
VPAIPAGCGSTVINIIVRSANTATVCTTPAGTSLRDTAYVITAAAAIAERSCRATAAGAAIAAGASSAT